MSARRSAAQASRAAKAIARLYPRPSRPDGRTPRRVTSSGGRESRFNGQVCEARKAFRLEPREVKAGEAPHVAMSPRKLVTATNCGADVGCVLHCGFCSRLVAG